MLGALLLAADLYVANATTFGCTSTGEVAKLQQTRAAKEAFQKELIEQEFQGQCVEIAKGKVVEGAIDPGGSAVLRIDRQVQPPGFMAPSGDFDKLKPAGDRK
jgi:hypothetical protein